MSKNRPYLVTCFAAQYAAEFLNQIPPSVCAELVSSLAALIQSLKLVEVDEAIAKWDAMKEDLKSLAQDLKQGTHQDPHDPVAAFSRLADAMTALQSDDETMKSFLDRSYSEENEPWIQALLEESEQSTNRWFVGIAGLVSIGFGIYLACVIEPDNQFFISAALVGVFVFFGIFCLIVGLVGSNRLVKLAARVIERIHI